MASHRMHDSDRPRRPVPAWVTAPVVETPEAPEDSAGTGQEAHPASATTAPAADTAGSTPGQVASAPAPGSVPDAGYPEIIVPDYPPSEEHLPPAPTSPTVHTRPFDRGAELAAQAPVSPVDAAAAAGTPDLVGARMSAPPAPGVHVGPVLPRTGQPRFSVPGLEHVVVEGTEPEPSGPVGYRTPRRFAHQQGAAMTPGTPAPTLAPAEPSTLAAPVGTPVPVVTGPATEATGSDATGPDATGAEATGSEATGPVEAAPSLPSEDQAAPTEARPARIGATPGAVLGVVAALATVGLAAWWFTAPSTVHAVGLVLGLVALVCGIATLRNPAATWQRPAALLATVLGAVGTLALLFAVASALLPAAGVTLPDVTGTGTVPTIAP